MMTVTIAMDEPPGDELRRRMDRGFRAALASVADALRAEVPVRTGALKGSVRADVTGWLTGAATAGAPYASHLDKGTGVYGPRGRAIEIRPRIRRALFWPGARYPVGRVTVKGVRPLGFALKAIGRADADRAFDYGFQG